MFCSLKIDSHIKMNSTFWDTISLNKQMRPHTLTGHFIRYTLLVPGWTPFCLQNCLNSSWNRFNKVLETSLRNFGSYWHDSITQLLHICRLHIHDVNLPFHHIPKCSIGLRSGDCGGLLSKMNCYVLWVSRGCLPEHNKLSVWRAFVWALPQHHNNKISVLTD